NQVHDAHGGAWLEPVARLELAHDLDDVGLALFFRGKLVEQPFDRLSQLLRLTEGVGILARARRVKNVLVSLVDVKQVARHGAARAEKVDLEHQHALVALGVSSGVLESTPPSQKCSPSISIGGKPGGSAALAMMCSGPRR